MAIGDELTESLINVEVTPAPLPTSVFTIAENYISATRPLRDSQATNPVSLDPTSSTSPRWIWAEVCEQCWLAFPITGMYVLQYIMALASIIFVGHLGSLPLAAVSLGSSFTGITGGTVLTGLASAMETLCGQAYGAKQYELLGIYLQRATVILLLAGAPIGILWLNMGSILVAVGEDPAIAEAAQSYTYWLLPLLVVYACLFPLVKFFQMQKAVFQLMLCSALAVVFHVPLLWLLIDKWNMGNKGLAVGVNASMLLHVSLLVGFVRFSPRFGKTFTSFSREALGEFGEFFRLAIPSAIMYCLEHWSYEILTLLAGLLPNSGISIATFTICFTLLSLSNMPALALGVVTSVRVSNELGAGKTHAARSVVAVSLVIGAVNGLVMASLIHSLRDVWGWVFSNDAEVVEHVACTAPCLAVLAILYAVQCILSGVVRGIGWQRAGAFANLGAYYVVGLPVALVLVFVFHFDGRGLWLGMGFGVATQTIALICIIACTNWDDVAREALVRSHSFSSRLPTSSTPRLAKPLLEDDGHSPEEPQKDSIET